MGPVSHRRRQVLGALAGSALGGCAAPPILPPRSLDRAATPRVGDTWAYHYTSAFRALPPRTLEVRLLEVGAAGLRDRIAFEAGQGGEEHAFSSAVEMVERPLDGFPVYELSPYLQAFGPLPAEASVAVPPPTWGQPFTGRARLRGDERVTVPAGSFEAARVDYEISRTPFGTLQPRIDPAFTLATVWYAAAVRRPVQWRLVTRASALNILVDDTYRLAGYRAA